MLEEDDEYFHQVDTVYICPPNNDIATDEESGDEEDEQVHHMTRSQLTAEAEVRQNGQTLSDEDEPFQDLQPATKKMKCNWSWSKRNRKNIQSDFVGLPNLPYAEEDLTPTEVFQKLITDEMIDFMVTETNRYAFQKEQANLQVTSTEMKVFLAINILSGYANLPRRYMYWEIQDDVHNVAVSNAMRRNRFIQIMKYFHLSNNDDMDVNDKFCKLRPYYTKLNKSFLENCPWSECLNVDESMCPYYAHHGAKMYIRGKPIRFGFKNWCLNLSSGYLVQFDTYGGASARNNFNNYRQEFGLGGSIVLGLCEVLPRLQNCSFRLFFDNYFTSFSLVKALAERNIFITGTLRNNRLGNCPLLPVKEMEKKERGFYDHR